MIYLLYALVALIVVFLSVKAAKYVDLLDKTTNLSGAFIGGILLSAVTSLPELLTSISATVWLDNPGLSIGNILGSNLFNLATLSMLILIFIKTFKKSKISSSHYMTAIFSLLIYMVIILNMTNILNVDFLTINVTSIIILILYILGVRTMASDNSAVETLEKEINSEKVDLTLKQIIIRFILASVGLVVFSILITYITDIISARLNLGSGFAGALFLGIATSLPEVTSSISLVKMNSFNIAVGNIVGSNLFNFLILTIADLLYIKGTIYTFADSQTVNLLILGTAATPLMLLSLKSKNKRITILYSLGVVVCYLLFLIL